MRKAVTTKRTKSGIPDKTNISIKEVHVKGNNYCYKAILATGDYLPISPSEFEFLEEAEFVVSVLKTTTYVENITVKAKDRKAAEAQALIEAEDLEFKGEGADYSVMTTSQL